MKNTKIAQAGYRVLEVLKELARRPLSPVEMLRYLEDTTDYVFRKEVMNKYLNTLKLLNIDIVKVNDKYCLNSSIEGITLDDTDLSIMLFLKKYLSSISHESLRNNIEESLQLMEQCFNPKTRKKANSRKIRAYKPAKPLVIRDDNVRKFEKYCSEGLKIKIGYKKDKDSSEVIYKISPVKLMYKRCQAVLIGYDSKENAYKEFVLENITYSEQTPQMTAEANPSAVLFKLKGRLAHAYVIKRGEVILEEGSDFIIVSNKGEDRELLLKRLLRYFENCEILYPKVCRERLIQLVEEMEQIYA